MDSVVCTDVSLAHYTLSFTLFQILPVHVSVVLFAVQCTPGTYYNGSTSECVPCMKGNYQDQGGRESCVPCGQDETTIGPGATMSTDCIGQAINIEANHGCNENFYRKRTLYFYVLFIRYLPQWYILQHNITEL